MGYLYNEIIECKHKKSLKYVWKGLLALLALDVLVTIMLAYRGNNLETLFAGFLVFTIATVPAYHIWIKTNSRYRYSIIDNEFIIERLNGYKRKVLLNINVKTIEKLEKVDQRLKNSEKLSKWKKYAFMEQKSKQYLCIYKVGQNTFGFCFEPSQRLLDKIYNVIGEKIVA